MPSQATGFISVNDLKTELRIPADVTDHDSLILTCLEDSVSWVSGFIKLPLLDTVENFDLDCLVNGVWKWRDPVLVSVERLRYWQDETGPDVAPRGFVDSSQFSVFTARGGYWHVLQKPSDGWPSDLRGPTIRLEVNRGFAAGDARLPLIRRALVLLVRHFYTAGVNVKPGTALIQSVNAIASRAI